MKKSREAKCENIANDCFYPFLPPSIFFLTHVCFHHHHHHHHRHRHHHHHIARVLSQPLSTTLLLAGARAGYRCSGRARHPMRLPSFPGCWSTRRVPESHRCRPALIRSLTNCERAARRCRTVATFHCCSTSQSKVRDAGRPPLLNEFLFNSAPAFIVCFAELAIQPSLNLILRPRNPNDIAAKASSSGSMEGGSGSGSAGGAGGSSSSGSAGGANSSTVTGGGASGSSNSEQINLPQQQSCGGASGAQGADDMTTASGGDSSSCQPSAATSSMG